MSEASAASETESRAASDLPEEERMALAELVSRVVERGVVITGDLVISVGDVDLLYLSLDVLLATVDRVRELPGTAKN